MSEVVSLRGHRVCNPYEPVPETIAELEALLEAAQAGQIKGFYGVIIYGDDSAACVSTLMASYRAVGALSTLAVQLANEINEEE